MATNGIATILIAYGVVLESRDDLMELYGLYPQHRNPYERKVDKICHGYGLLYLVLGLLVEMLKEVITAPNTIINTDGIDWPLAAIAVVFLLISGVLLLVHSWKLLKLRFACVSHLEVSRPSAIALRAHDPKLPGTGRQTP